MVIDSRKVQNEMLRLGVGIHELARLAKVTPKIITALQKGDKKVFLPTVSKLAKALGVEPATLIKSR